MIENREALRYMFEGYHARLAPYPLWVHAEFWRAYGQVWRHVRRPDYELGYGAIHPGVLIGDWYPDLETNTPDEVIAWAAAAKADRQGEQTATIEPSNPDHPYGCTAFHGWGLGTYVVGCDGWKDEPEDDFDLEANAMNPEAWEEQIA